MVTNKSKKSKKTLTTTLGKAPNHNEVIDDLSQVLKPIDTSIYGIRQVLSIFHKGTEEVKNYLTFECDILFECRICRSIFRSLANFILHKRNYCQDRFYNVNCFREDDEELSSSVDRSNEEADEEVLSEKTEKTGLAGVIDKLKEKHKIHDLSERVLKEDLSGEARNDNHLPKKINSNVLLEKIASNNAAVFQTVLENLPKKSIIRPDLMKSEVMEIHGILDKNEAVLDEHGKIAEFETDKLKSTLYPKPNLVCSECNLKFSTKKTLTYHLKYKHNNSRLVYICPECKDSFANAWSVFRHLLKVHRKTHTQVKRLRHQVNNSVVRRDDEPSRKKQLKQEEKVADDENQWLDNIEGDKDFQMCGGCGKRFERKAALQSHVQMCTKRIEVCNTIKENKAKKKDEESRDVKTKMSRLCEKASPSEKRAGASKRKPYSLRTYKPGVNSTIDLTVLDDVTEKGNSGMKFPESNCDIEVIQNLEYSDEFSEFNSPVRMNSSMTPLLETMDTEKMLSIIGIPESHMKVSQQKSPEVQKVSPHLSSKNITESHIETSSQNCLESENVSPCRVKDSLETDIVLFKESRKPSIESQIEDSQQDTIENEKLPHQSSLRTGKASSQPSRRLSNESHVKDPHRNSPETEKASSQVSVRPSNGNHIEDSHNSLLESDKVPPHTSRRVGNESPVKGPQRKSPETMEVPSPVSIRPINEIQIKDSRQSLLESDKISPQTCLGNESHIKCPEQHSSETDTVCSQVIESHIKDSCQRLSESDRVSLPASRRLSNESHVESNQEDSPETGTVSPQASSSNFSQQKSTRHSHGNHIKISRQKSQQTEKITPQSSRKSSTESSTRAPQKESFQNEKDFQSRSIKRNRVSPQIYSSPNINTDDSEIEKSNTTYSAGDSNSFCSKNVEIIDITDDKDDIPLPVVEQTSTDQSLDSSSSSRGSTRKAKTKKRKRVLSSNAVNAKLFKLSEEFIGSTDLDYIQRAEPYMDSHTMKCVPCQLTYDNYSELIWHMSAHFSWFRYQCSQCSFISWSKKACRNHAIESHNVDEEILNSVVLEIPDWKIGLMTHSFRQLPVDDLDLRGRHTDEIIVVSEEEDVVVKKEAVDKDDKNMQYENNLDVLFSEADIQVETTEEVCNNHNNTRTDSIDIDDGDGDLFLMDVPEEIITHSSDDIEYYQRFRVESPDSIGKDEFIPVPPDVMPSVDNEICINTSDFDINDENRQAKNADVTHSISEVPEFDNSEAITEVETQPCFKAKTEFTLLQPPKDTFVKTLDHLPTVRSTRTRIPSIKTSQVDFLYDLNGVIKMNNLTTNPKQKKNVNSSNSHHQRNLKESEPACPNPKAMKVYLKK